MPRYGNYTLLFSQVILYLLWGIPMLYVPSTAAAMSNQAVNSGSGLFWRSRGVTVFQQHLCRVAALLVVASMFCAMWIPLSILYKNPILTLHKQILLTIEQIILVLSYSILSSSIGSVLGQFSAALGTVVGIILPLFTVWFMPFFRLWLAQFQHSLDWLTWITAVLPPSELCWRPAALVFAWPHLSIFILAGICSYALVWSLVFIGIFPKKRI